jgi:hypothetical protein
MLLATLVACASPTTRFDPPFDESGTFADCCGGLGTCVPSGLVMPAQGARLERAQCGEALLCAPTAWVEDINRAPPACRATRGREGRCLPECLPEVARQAARLSRSGCDAAHACVPCYDPISGADTQACRFGADAPGDPPQPFERCCAQGGASLGVCVPVELLSNEQGRLLPVDSCGAPDTRCAPSELASAGTVPPSCGVQRGDGGPPLPGLCLPSCFIAASLLAAAPAEGCDSGRRCALCAALGPNVPGCP